MKLKHRLYNRIYASIWRYFWLPCPLCGQMFGGHETGNKTIWLSSHEGRSCCKVHDNEPENELTKHPGYPAEYFWIKEE